MNKTKKIAGFLGLPYYIWAAAFIIIPLLMVVWYGLTDKNGAFTLANVLAIWQPAHRKALLLSLLLSLGSTLLCLLLAYPLCMFLVGMQKQANSFLVMLLIVPMWMNFLLRTYAWQSILERSGIINTALAYLGLPRLQLINNPGAIILGMVYDFLPFMILPIYNVMVKIDNNLIEAAYDLGASGKTVLTKVLLPLSMPGIISGITMVFVPAVTTFVISQILGGGKIYLIGNIIEQEFTLNGNRQLGSGLSLVMMVFILISMALLNKFDKNGEGSII